MPRLFYEKRKIEIKFVFKEVVKLKKFRMSKVAYLVLYQMENGECEKIQTQ